MRLTHAEVVRVSSIKRISVNKINFRYIRLQASLPEADRHDTSAIYRKLTLAQLQKEVPQVRWLEYLSAFLDADITDQEPVVSYALPYFVEMGKILERTDKRYVFVPIKS